MAEIGKAEVRYVDTLPASGNFPGELVVVFSRSGPVGQYSYAVDTYVWDAAEAAWEKLLNASDPIVLSGAISGDSLTVTGIVTSNGLTVGAAVLNEVELERIDSITNGVHSPSKVVVPDTNLELEGIGIIRKVDTLIPTASVLTLNATPITVVPAPAAGTYLEFVGAAVFLDFATVAYGTIAAGEDLVFKYTNAAGAQLSNQLETTGFLDQTADQVRLVRPVTAAVGSDAPVDAAAIVLHLLVGEVATGDSPLKVRVWYRQIRKAALEAIA